jgi:hypothetical protein
MEFLGKLEILLLGRLFRGRVLHFHLEFLTTPAEAMAYFQIR